MSATAVRIPVEHPVVESVGGLLCEPETPRGSAVLLAHGAGTHMESGFMAAIAEGLCARGFCVLRFDYPYMERVRREGRRRPPDPAPRLEAAHAAALAVLSEQRPGERLIMAGKSLGGRMSSRLAAKGERCAGLVLLGYPLHPPRRPEKLRDEHFPAICQPALFLQGTRDDLCDLDLLRRSLARFGGTATLHVIDDANHSFEVRKRTGRTSSEVQGELLDAIESWELRAFPSP